MLSRSPTSCTLPPVVLGRTCSCLLPPSCQPTPGGNSWPLALNSGGASRSKSRRGDLASSSSPDPGPLWGGMYSKKGAVPSSSCTLWHLLFHPQNLLLWQSQLWKWAQMPSWPWVMDQPQLLHFLPQGICSGQGPLMGFPHLSKVPLSGGVPPSTPWGFVPRRLDVSQTMFLYPLQRFALLLPQVVFEGGHYLCGQFLHPFPAPTVGTLVASWTCIPHTTGPWTPPC